MGITTLTNLALMLYLRFTNLSFNKYSSAVLKIYFPGCWNAWLRGNVHFSIKSQNSPFQ